MHRKIVALLKSTRKQHTHTHKTFERKVNVTDSKTCMPINQATTWLMPIISAWRSRYKNTQFAHWYIFTLKAWAPII